MNPSGLELMNDNSDKLVVDFEECRNNWIAYRKRINRPIHSGINDMVIGQRDCCSEHPYIEFFTKPFTKVEFDSVMEYKKIRNLIEEYGYRTVDLS